jgi:hypothetical protein
MSNLAWFTLGIVLLVVYKLSEIPSEIRGRWGLKP